MTPRINRHRRSVEIEVVPCTKYNFRVIASEDWKGMREDFKVFSEGVGFKVEYTPKFINPPMVKERGRRYHHFLCFALKATELQIFKDHCQARKRAWVSDRICWFVADRLLTWGITSRTWGITTGTTMGPWWPIRLEEEEQGNTRGLCNQMVKAWGVAIR